MLDQVVMMDQAAHALEMAYPLRASQWLSQIMKPSRGQLFLAIQLLNSETTSGVAQKLEPPAEVDASSPISNFSPAMPVKLAMGVPWAGRFLQLRQTSCRYPTEPPAKLSYPLLQAWGWQKSMKQSAIWTIGTKQFQGCPALSGEGTYPTVWMMVTSSGETMMSLLGPMASRRDWMVLATVRGVAMQLSMSRSMPSSPQLTRMSAREEMKLLMVVLVEKTKPQLPFCPPTEISTFLPLSCHLDTRV